MAYAMTFCERFIGHESSPDTDLNSNRNPEVPAAAKDKADGEAGPCPNHGDAGPCPNLTLHPCRLVSPNLLQYIDSKCQAYPRARVYKCVFKNRFKA